MPRLSHRLPGYLATGLMMVATGLWAFWGFMEMYYEGWGQPGLLPLAYLIPGRVLETGFGTGSLLIEMTQRGLDVIGMDPSWPMQQVTGRKASRTGVSPRRLCGVAQHLPFPAGSFANVLSTFPTNYISDPESLAGVHRILAPSGRWVILGLGLRYKSWLKHFMAGWLLGDWVNSWIQSFIALAKTMGYSSRLIQHETEAYILPVLILEKNDDQRS